MDECAKHFLSMFDFLQVMFSKVAVFVASIVVSTGLGPPPAAQSQPAPTASIQQTVPPAASEIASSPGTASDEITVLRKEIEDLKRQRATSDTSTAPPSPLPAGISHTSATPSPTPAQTRPTYPIEPLPNLSAYTPETQQAARAAYSKFLSIPDLKYKTPAEQVSLYNSLIMDEVARINAGKAQASVQKMGADFSTAANTKAQSLSVLNQILSDVRSLEVEQSGEISRMNDILDSLVGESDYASELLREQTTLRRDRLISGLGTLITYISNLENFKRSTESMDALAFLNFNPNQVFADEIKFESDAKAAFQADKAFYDDSLRTYLSIQESL